MKEKAGNIFLLLLCVILVVSCSTGRNTPYSRAYHELKTRYNIYHNAQESYDNILNDQQTIFPDNGFKLLPFYHSNADEEKTLTGGPFDVVIDKTEKAIGKHSISTKPKRDPSKAYSEDYRKWLKQIEFNPFIGNVWLLLGKAHIQNCDYDEALSVFSEIVNIFYGDTELTTETQLWMLRTYTEMQRFYDAQNLIYILKTRKMPQELAKLFIEFNTHYLLESRQFKEAVPLLIKVIDNTDKDIVRKKRLQFLLGQVYMIIDDYENAEKTFNKVKGISTPKTLNNYADSYLYAFSSGAEQPDLIADLLTKNLVKDNTSISYTTTHTPPKNSFQLYWEANLKRNITEPISVINPKLNGKTEFVKDNFSPHLLILLLSDQSAGINDLLFSTADFNFSNFKLRTFNLSIVRLNRRESLRIEPFSSLDDATKYLQVLRSDTVYRSAIQGTATPLIISKENFNILQNSTLDDYKAFYKTNIDNIPKDIYVIKSQQQDESLLQSAIHYDNNSAEDSLSLKYDSVQYLKATGSRTNDIRTTDLKSILEQKEAEMMQRAKEPSYGADRIELLKKREQFRKERIKQREKELRERERKREAEIKRREKERELKLREQKRGHK